MLGTKYISHLHETYRWIREWIVLYCINLASPFVYYCCLVAESCPTPCDPMDCSCPGYPVHGISQARMLEWVAISFSRGSSWPRDWIHISWAGRQILYHSATREAALLCVVLVQCWPQGTSWSFIIVKSGRGSWCKVPGTTALIHSTALLV